MKRQLKSEGNIPRRIVRLLNLTGISVALAMVSLAIWMSRTVDELSTEFYQTMIASALHDQTDHLRILTEKDANWHGASEWIQAGDTDQVLQNIGTSTTETGLFDYSYIYDVDGTLLYAYEAGGSQSDQTLTQPKIAEDVISRIHGAADGAPTVVTEYFMFEGQVAAVAASPFRGAPHDENAPHAQTILLNVVILGDSILQHMEEALLLSDISINLLDSGTENTIPLPLLGSIHKAYLVWEPPKTGSELWTRSLGAIAVVCILTALGHFIVGRITMRLAEAFLRESHEARNDRLTGLLNRAGVEEELDSRRVQDALNLNRLALILLDMDCFKAINDTYGHAAGDLALQNMSERIQSIVRRNDIAARMGGDEFLLVIIDDNPQAIVTMITGRLAEAGRKPVTISQDANVLVQASMGAAIAKPGVSMRELMMSADKAMYEAKTARAFLRDSQNDKTETGTETDESEKEGLKSTVGEVQLEEFTETSRSA